MTPTPQVTDAAVVKALAHPIRAQVLGILERGVASPTQLAGEIGAPLPNVSYHVTQLHQLGLITLDSEARRRGAIEHYYRLGNLKVDRVPATVDDEGFAALAEETRRFIARVGDIERESAQRLDGADGDRAFTAHVVVVLYEVPADS